MPTTINYNTGNGRFVPITPRPAGIGATLNIKIQKIQKTAESVKKTQETQQRVLNGTISVNSIPGNVYRNKGHILLKRMEADRLDAGLELPDVKDEEGRIAETRFGINATLADENGVVKTVYWVAEGDKDETFVNIAVDDRVAAGSGERLYISVFLEFPGRDKYPYVRLLENGTVQLLNDSKGKIDAKTPGPTAEQVAEAIANYYGGVPNALKGLHLQYPKSVRQNRRAGSKNQPPKIMWKWISKIIGNGFSGVIRARFNNRGIKSGWTYLKLDAEYHKMTNNSRGICPISQFYEEFGEPVRYSISYNGERAYSCQMSGRGRFIYRTKDDEADQIGDSLPAVKRGFAVFDGPLTKFELDYRENITRIDRLPNIKAANSMFEGCTNLTRIDTQGLSMEGVQKCKYLFENCISLKSLDVSEWDTSSLVEVDRMFRCCESLKQLDVSNWDTSKFYSMYALFAHCYNLEALDVSKWDTGSFWNPGALFEECRKLKYLDVANWDMSNAKYIQNIFNGCRELRYVDVSRWDVRKATSMSAMFLNCYKLENPMDLSAWRTDALEGTLKYIFLNCRAIPSINLSGWNTSKVTDMSVMFAQCHALMSLNLSGWDTSKATTFASAFQACTSLRRIDISDWSFDSAETIQSMFQECSALEEIVFGNNVDLSSVTAAGNAFYNCTSLTTVRGSLSGLTASIGLGTCPLTRESALVFLNATAPASATLQFKATTYDQLSSSDIAIATSKGWTVARV